MLRLAGFSVRVVLCELCCAALRCVGCGGGAAGRGNTGRIRGHWGPVSGPISTKGGGRGPRKRGQAAQFLRVCVGSGPIFGGCSSALVLPAGHRRAGVWRSFRRPAQHSKGPRTAHRGPAQRRPAQHRGPTQHSDAPHNTTKTHTHTAPVFDWEKKTTTRAPCSKRKPRSPRTQELPRPARVAPVDRMTSPAFVSVVGVVRRFGSVWLFLFPENFPPCSVLSKRLTRSATRPRVCGPTDSTALTSRRITNDKPEAFSSRHSAGHFAGMFSLPSTDVKKRARENLRGTLGGISLGCSPCVLQRRKREETRHDRRDLRHTPRDSRREI